MIEGTNAYFYPTAVQLLFQRHIFQCLGHAFSEQVIAALGFATIVSPKPDSQELLVGDLAFF